ncbi:8-oxoguanine DNA glycosylase OGG fold protein [Egicoccus halophilus]|uniref:8-oxoguanine DNA glycosylase OGG fold protein n=1 Tax=Egicoccus halophilus TaxID=1670830 RepID=UPI00351A0FC5
MESAASPDAVAANTRVLDVATNGALDRDALFSLAEIADWDALHLATLIWGYGRFANLTHRKAVKQFVATEPTVRAEVCEEVRINSRAGWGRWWIGKAQTAIPGLRVAMGTKLLYFAGYDSPARPRPLIYDRRVHSQLTALGYDLTNPTAATASSAGRTTTGPTSSCVLRPQPSVNSNPKTSSTPSSVPPPDRPRLSAFRTQTSGRPRR